MPIEELIAEYERERKNIIRSQKRQDEIIEQIRNANKDDYDWVSVQYAAKKLGVSGQTIYRWIDNGKIKKVRHLGGCKRVSWKEISGVDDKYQY